MKINVLLWGQSKEINFFLGNFMYYLEVEVYKKDLDLELPYIIPVDNRNSIAVYALSEGDYPLSHSLKDHKINIIIQVTSDKNFLDDNQKHDLKKEGYIRNGFVFVWRERECFKTHFCQTPLKAEFFRSECFYVFWVFRSK